jgi:glycosyltransferase involved in cell wall biosynthesis
MPNFKISIITVVKNGMPFLKEAIESFDLQTYPNKEQIIVYSKSEDETEKYLNSLNNSKIIIKDEHSKNMYGALNLAVKNCSGDYIGVLHADDFFPNKDLILDLSNFIDNTNADIIYGNTKFCKKDNTKHIIRVWNSAKFDRRKLKYGWMPPHTTMYIKKDIMLENLYTEKYSVSGDYEFILKILLNDKFIIKFFDKTLVIMRAGGESTKITSLLKKFLQDIQVSKKFFKNYYICTLLKILRKFNQFF